jgi:hypothetical protein
LFQLPPSKLSHSQEPRFLHHYTSDQTYLKPIPHQKINLHQILDIDTIDWSDIEIDLPVSQQRIINIKDEFSHLYYLLIQSTIKGMVSYSQVLQAIKIDIGETWRIQT